jgi:hypothetical protein
LSSVAATAIIVAMARAIGSEAPVGDKSPKSKQRDQKQKDAAKAGSAAAAKSKQLSNSQPQTPGEKGRK